MMQLTFQDLQPRQVEEEDVRIDTQLAQLFDHADTLESIDVSEEGLKLFLLSTADLFGRFANNLKTILFKWPRSLKRSELRAFSESNMTRLAALEGLSYDHFNDKDTVHIPDGMTMRFVDGWELISRAYNVFDIIQTLDANYQLMSQTYTIIQRGGTVTDTMKKQVGQQDFIAFVTKLLKQQKHRNVIQAAKDPAMTAIRNAEQIFSTVNIDKSGTVVVKDTSGKTFVKSRFMYQYSHMRMFKDFRLHMLSSEMHLIDLSGIESRMERINHMAQLIIDFYNKSEEKHDQAAIQSIATQLRLIAELVSYYGYCAGVHITFEHNYALSAYDMIKAKL